MKKFMFLMFLALGLVAGNAKAQGCDSSVVMTLTDYFPGYNNTDSFSWYITGDGYVNYTLTDNGPSYSEDETYESLAYISGAHGYTNPDHIGGGSFSDSFYIGAVEQDIIISHDCGYITGPYEYQCSAEEWSLHVVFNTTAAIRKNAHDFKHLLKQPVIINISQLAYAANNKQVRNHSTANMQIIKQAVFGE